VKKAEHAAKSVALPYFYRNLKLRLSFGKWDSSPHFCDNRTDLIRTARIDLAPRPFFGTRPFHPCNVCADFSARATHLKVRLYHFLLVYHSPRHLSIIFHDFSQILLRQTDCSAGGVCVLLKILHGRTEHTDLKVARNILVKSVSDTLGVSHLTEHTAVGRGDTLDSVHGIVGIEANVACNVAVKINVLCGDLTVFGKLVDKIVGGQESAFAVRNRNSENVSNGYTAKPRGLIGSHSYTHHTGLVS